MRLSVSSIDRILFCFKNHQIFGFCHVLIGSLTRAVIDFGAGISADLAFCYLLIRVRIVCRGEKAPSGGIVDGDAGLNVVGEYMEADTFSFILYGIGFHLDAAGYEIVFFKNRRNAI